MAGQSKPVGQPSQIRRSKGRLIIAIDSGTTRCQVAFAAVTHTNEMFPLPDFGHKGPQIEEFVDWPGFNDKGDSCPSTTLYYPNLGKLPITGHELKGLFRNPKPEATNVTRIFRLWKLLFHSPDDPAIHDIQQRLQGLLDLNKKTARGLIRDWVALMYQELLTEGCGRPSKLKYMFDLRNLDIEIVVPVPPGRTAIAHDEVLKAFIQGPITADQVFLVSEPEALFRAWVHDVKTHDWELCDRYLVLDAGGGTGNIVRYRLTDVEPGAAPRFEQEFESESIICGSETISDQFEKLAGSKVGEDEPNRSWVLDQMRREFDERCKYTFGSSQEKWSYLANRPGSPTVVDEYTYEEIARCFDQCVDKLIAAIERQLAQGEIVNYLILGGGLCTNDYVLKAIESKFGAKLNIRRVSSLKCHVAKGAILTRLYGEFIERRPVKWSVGVRTLWPVNNQIENSPYYDQLERFTENDTGLEYFWAVQWLAKKAQLVDKRHELSSEANYANARTRSFPLKADEFTFHDHIVLVDYSPGDVEFTPVRKDGTFMDHLGSSLPGPVKEETLIWNAEDMGVSITGLQVKPREGRRYRILHYSIQMELKEVSTKYWIKAWSLTNKNSKSAVPIVSSPISSEPLFDRQNVSQNLLRSFDLGSGIGKQVPREMVDSQRHHLDRGQERPSTTSHSSSSQRAEQRPSAVGRTGHLTPMDPPSSHMERRCSLSDHDQNGPVQNLSKASEVRMRQSTDSSVEYAEGAPRNNGGCWTCLFRKTACGQEPEVCRECLELGLMCEYGCPRWWYNEDLREAQKRINAGLISRQKASLRKRKRSVGQMISGSSPMNRTPIRHRADAESHGFLPQTRVPERTRFPHAEMSHGSLSKLDSEGPQNQHEDLYGASPVPLVRGSQKSVATFAPSDELGTVFNYNGEKHSEKT